MTTASTRTTPLATGDMPPEDFRKFGHQLVDWVADFLKGVDGIPVTAAMTPGELRDRLPDHAPPVGEDMAAILADVDRLIMPAMTHWNHPSNFAYFNSSGSAPGILAETLTAAFNVNCMLWESCPAGTELEGVTLDWLRQLLGLPGDFWGIIYEGAAFASLHAIVAAREHARLALGRDELTGPDAPRLRAYASDQAHSSVEKGVKVLGLGKEALHKIPVDDAYRMRADLLDRAVREDRAGGWTPFCVVGTVGTTSSTAIDPIPAIAEICRREGLWLHVDAAHGGTAALVPEMRHVLAGCEHADSFVVNPHKWMFVPIDLSAFYTRKPDVLKSAFSLVPEYLRTTHDDEVANYMDYGVTLGRRFRALKLWFVLRYFGADGLAARIREHLRLAQLFAAWVDGHAAFERMAPVPLSTVCFRAHPKGVDDLARLNALNERLKAVLNASRRVFMTHTKLGEAYVLRFVISHLRMREEHVRRGWETIQEALGQVEHDAAS